MILVDVNIFEDVIRKRKGWQGSIEFLSLVKAGLVKGYISPITPLIIYYLRPQNMPDALRRRKVKEIIEGVKIAHLAESLILLALEDERFSDFEDAIQWRIAQSNGFSIVSRNKKHLVISSEVKVQTPEEFLSENLKKVIKS